MPSPQDQIVEEGRWMLIEAERVLYVDRGRVAILCDRLPSPVTLLVKPGLRTLNLREDKGSG